MSWTADGHGSMSAAGFADDLEAVADELAAFTAGFDDPLVADPLDKLKMACGEVGRAASGSWIGNQALVYYKGFTPPPAGALFSQEWGFMAVFAPGTRGDWEEYSREEVLAEIDRRSGGADLRPAEELASEGRDLVSETIQTIKSILSPFRGDEFIADCLERVNAVRTPDAGDVVQVWRPLQIVTRDSASASQGFFTPPHQARLAEVIAVRATQKACLDVAKIARQTSSHLARNRRSVPDTRGDEERVFIGHGHSPLWRELKDFVADRLGLPWDEFNRVPVAGVSNVARLEQMLDNAGIAFLILTAEEEQIDGTMQARQNVVNEAGLFQGRVGFRRAIVLLEEGCEEFSNIEGLGQIRFPRGNIVAAFEDVRAVLEREGFIA